MYLAYFGYIFGVRGGEGDTARVMADEKHS